MIINAYCSISSNAVLSNPSVRMAITNNVFSRITADFRQQWGIHFRFIFRVIVMFVIPFLCVVITVSLCNIGGPAGSRDSPEPNGPPHYNEKGTESDHHGNQIISRSGEKRGQGNSSKIQQDVRNEMQIYKTDGAKETGGEQMTLSEDVRRKSDGLVIDGKFSLRNDSEISVGHKNDSKSQDVIKTDEEEDGKLVPVFTLRPESDPNYRQPNNTPDTSYLYGKCIRGRNHILLYNRVPKCGSRTLLSLTETLAERHAYHKPGEIVISRYKGKKEEIPYANIVRRRLKNTAVASILHGHIHFIDFSRDQQLLPHKRPIYINLIRDPFDRLMSQYYFVRFGDGKFTNLKQLHKMTHPKHMNESFNECVQLDRPECVGPYMQTLMVKYFCGYSPDCQEPTEGALEKAKQNLDKYVVVGVAEDYEDFLKVLEKLLPDFFGGIVDEFKTSTERRREKKMKAKKKDPATPEVKEKVKALLEMDYRFYNHTRARFQELKQSLGIQ